MKLFVIPLVIAMLTSLADVNFAQLGEQISENAALVLANAEAEGGNSQGNQNGQGNQGGNSQGGGGSGGGGGPTQPPKPEEPDGTFTVEHISVANAPSGFSYPPLTVIESRQELEAYYNENNHPLGSVGGTLDNNSRGISGGRTFRETMDLHDDAYFEKNVLVIVSAWVITGYWFEVESIDYENSVVHIQRKGERMDAIHESMTWNLLVGLPKKNVQSTDFILSQID